MLKAPTRFHKEELEDMAFRPVAYKLDRHAVWTASLSERKYSNSEMAPMSFHTLQSQEELTGNDLSLQLQSSQPLHHEPLLVSQPTGFPDLLHSLQVAFAAGGRH